MEEFLKMIVGDYEIISEVYVLIRLSVVYFIFNYILEILNTLKNIGRGVRP